MYLFTIVSADGCGRQVVSTPCEAYVRVDSSGNIRIRDATNRRDAVKVAPDSAVDALLRVVRVPDSAYMVTVLFNAAAPCATQQPYAFRYYGTRDADHQIRTRGYAVGDEVVTALLREHADMVVVEAACLRNLESPLVAFIDRALAHVAGVVAPPSAVVAPLSAVVAPPLLPTTHTHTHVHTQAVVMSRLQTVVLSRLQAVALARMQALEGGAAVAVTPPHYPWHVPLRGGLYMNVATGDCVWQDALPPAARAPPRDAFVLQTLPGAGRRRVLCALATSGAAPCRPHATTCRGTLVVCPPSRVDAWAREAAACGVQAAVIREGREFLSVGLSFLRAQTLVVVPVSMMELLMLDEAAVLTTAAATLAARPTLEAATMDDDDIDYAANIGATSPEYAQAARWVSRGMAAAFPAAHVPWTHLSWARLVVDDADLCCREAKTPDVAGATGLLRAASRWLTLVKINAATRMPLALATAKQYAVLLALPTAACLHRPDPLLAPHALASLEESALVHLGMEVQTPIKVMDVAVTPLAEEVAAAPRDAKNLDATVRATLGLPAATSSGIPLTTLLRLRRAVPPSLARAAVRAQYAARSPVDAASDTQHAFVCRAIDEFESGAPPPCLVCDDASDTLTLCGHAFCHDCLAQSLRVAAGGGSGGGGAGGGGTRPVPPCPQCMQPLPPLHWLRIDNAACPATVTDPQDVPTKLAALLTLVQGGRGARILIVLPCAASAAHVANFLRPHVAVHGLTPPVANVPRDACIVTHAAEVAPLVRCSTALPVFDCVAVPTPLLPVYDADGLWLPDVVYATLVLLLARPRAFGARSGAPTLALLWERDSAEAAAAAVARHVMDHVAAAIDCVDCETSRGAAPAAAAAAAAPQVGAAT